MLKMRTSLRFCLLILAACVFTGGSIATAQTPAQVQRLLEEVQKRFPEADANGDGRLTVDEAKVYYARLKAENERKKAIQRRGQIKPTHANVPYGPADRNRLDLWLADSEEPTPLVIYIHGGGFVAGDKESISPQLIREAHEKGWSVASINYRFVNSSIMFPAPQQDGARAIQFLKHNREKYNLDPEKFAVYGGSAGAGISMWIGYKDDMADPDAKDPVLRESTRVAVVGSIGGQSSYDPFVIRDWIGGQAHAHPSIYMVYGVKTLEELTKPELKSLFNEVSAINHVTDDDPPTFMYYSEADSPLPPNARPGQGIHHPIFAHKLKEKLDEEGIPSVYRHVSVHGRDFVGPFLEFVERGFAQARQ